MARRRIAAKRKVLPDSVYGSEVVTRFITSVMRNGKKSIAEKIVYGSLDEIAKRSNKSAEEALGIFTKALENASPFVEVKAKRVGGSTYQIPVEVRAERKLALAMRWIIAAASSRSGKSMSMKLAAEMMDAAENRGGACKKKDETHRMANANKAFAHIRTNY